MRDIDTIIIVLCLAIVAAVLEARRIAELEKRVARLEVQVSSTYTIATACAEAEAGRD